MIDCFTETAKLEGIEEHEVQVEFDELQMIEHGIQANEELNDVASQLDVFDLEKMTRDRGQTIRK